MSVYHEKSRSAWMEIAPREFPALAANLTADVVVIGSGIAGLSTAYELVKGGSNVIIVDRGPIGRGMTARTSAHLTSACDDFYHEFVSIRGERIGRLHFRSHAAAIDRIEEIAAAEEIDCDFERLNAYLFLAGDAKPEVLAKERTALSKVGLKGVKKTKWPEVSHKLSDGPCLVIPDQGRFHPLRYLDGLAAACAQSGARLFGETCVTKIEEDKTGVTVDTRDGYKISAQAAVVATNTPINDRLTIHAKQAPYRTYVFGAKVPVEKIDDALYWDIEDPYHYVRLHPFGKEQRLLVGGADHKSGQVDDADSRFVKLEQWARERFPEMGTLTHRWSGHGHGRFCRVHRSQSGERTHFRRERRFRSRYYPRRSGLAAAAELDRQGQAPLGRGLRSGAETCAGGRQVLQRGFRCLEEFCRASPAWRNLVGRRPSARCWRRSTRRADQACRLSRRTRPRAPALSELHPCRLHRSLEFV